MLTGSDVTTLLGHVSIPFFTAMCFAASKMFDCNVGAKPLRNETDKTPPVVVIRAKAYPLL